MDVSRRSRARGATDEVQRITSVRSSLADDIAQRNRRYLAQMSVRVVCFLGAVAVDHWTRWLLLVGAVLLPYVAVVLANAGRERGTDPGTYLDPRGLPSAPPTPAPLVPDVAPAVPPRARPDGP